MTLALGSLAKASSVSQLCTRALLQASDLCCNHMQVAVLCWTHSVIGWGFFLFSFWIPAYLGFLGLTSLGSMGALSALPWAVSCPTLHVPRPCLSTRLRYVGHLAPFTG